MNRGIIQPLEGKTNKNRGCLQVSAVGMNPITGEFMLPQKLPCAVMTEQ
jgi:hypothetical protein